jgi:hypothetical protein
MRHSILFAFALSLVLPSPALAWNDITHMAVMKAAGLDDYAYLAVGPDMAKAKSGGHEEGNHYRDNKRGAVVTEDIVLDQVQDYNCRCSGGAGHLYGAIIAALDEYRELKQKNKHALYPLGFAAHYIADLSQPLHNIEYNDFNKANHAANDGAVEKGEKGTTDEKLARMARNIQQRMRSIPPYRLPSPKEGIKKFNSEVAKRIAEIANKAMAMGYAMQEANPPKAVMTTDEAYRQLAQSAMLLKAVYTAIGGPTQ